MEIEYVELEKMIKENKNKNRLAKYDSLTVLEKQELLKQLKQDQSKLETRTKEKQKIIDDLDNSTKKQGLLDKIDKLSKQTKNVIPVVSEDYTKTITIECSGGLVTDVTGLPEGYDYEIIDYDNKGVCKICGDTVIEHDWREHLCSHNPNADGLDWKELNEFFDDVF